MTNLMLAILIACVAQASCVRQTRIRNTGRLSDITLGLMPSPGGPSGSKRPLPMDMERATNIAFADETFVQSLVSAFEERDARLHGAAKRAKTAQNSPSTGLHLHQPQRPARATEERLWAKDARKAPLHVLPHEEASFRTFVERAQGWMKKTGIKGELTHEAAMRAWLAAAETAKQRVIAGGGRVEDHQHLQRFWSARDRGENGGLKKGLDDETHACSTSCQTESDLCAPCVLSDPHHVFGDTDLIRIPIPLTPNTSRPGRISCSSCRDILKVAMEHAETAKANTSPEQRIKSQGMIEQVVREYAHAEIVKTIKSHKQRMKAQEIIKQLVP